MRRLFVWLLVLLLLLVIAWPQVEEVRFVAADLLADHPEVFEWIDDTLFHLYGEARLLYAEILHALGQPTILDPPSVIQDDVRDPVDPPEQAWALFELANEARVEAGLEPLAWDEALARVATAHSRDMAESGFFGHVSPTTGEPQDRCSADEDVSWRFAGCGENLALHPNAQSAHRGLMDSEGHRENILSPNYTHLGVGVVGQGQRLYFTQKFGTAYPPDETRVVLFDPPRGADLRVDDGRLTLRGRAVQIDRRPVVWVQRQDRPRETLEVHRVDGEFTIEIDLLHGHGTYILAVGYQTPLRLEGVQWGHIDYGPQD